MATVTAMATVLRTHHRQRCAIQKQFQAWVVGTFQNRITGKTI